MAVRQQQDSPLEPDWMPIQAKLEQNRSPASFAYKVRELLRRKALQPEAPEWRLITKLGAYAFLDELQLPHARVYAVLDGIERLGDVEAPDRFVLKPLEGDSAAGVMLLSRSGGGWVDELRGASLSDGQLLEEAQKALRRRGFIDRWLIEEPLTSLDGQRVPDDFKVYAFQGEIALVLQRRGWVDGKRAGRYRWYDANWQPVVDTGKHADAVDDGLTPPRPDAAAALTDVAVHISRTVPFAFCRVDTYVTDRGVRVGEINSYVGAYDLFADEWDLRLGGMWELAELRVPDRWPLVPAAVVDGEYTAAMM